MNTRLKDFSDFVLSNKDYYPFKLLGEKVLYNIENNVESFLIQMDKGMGKTTFVKGFSNDYLSNAYSSKLSKDPFGDAMSNIEDKSMQLKIA